MALLACFGANDKGHEAAAAAGSEGINKMDSTRN